MNRLPKALSNLYDYLLQENHTKGGAFSIMTAEEIEEKYNNWAGGTCKHWRGYITILVGPDHNLANSYGYALLHRVMMQEFIGRPLLKSELVHHRNGCITDNRISNLKITNRKEHMVLHNAIRPKRKYKKYEKNGLRRKRRKGESNYLIYCECGCGEKLLKFRESDGVIRRRLPGHKRLSEEARDKISKNKKEFSKTRERDYYGRFAPIDPDIQEPQRLVSVAVKPQKHHAIHQLSLICKDATEQGLLFPLE